jgi:hypothetical protein
MRKQYAPAPVGSMMMCMLRAYDVYICMYVAHVNRPQGKSSADADGVCTARCLSARFLLLFRTRLRLYAMLMTWISRSMWRAVCGAERVPECVHCQR